MYYQKYQRKNKYNAKKTVYEGIRYDSAFEASVAQDLDTLKKSGTIKDWERQYKLEMWAYDKDGKPAIRKNHKVDFRVEHLDGSFELMEAKGFETADYRERRKWLEKLWLPEHLDHIYTVVKESSPYYTYRRTFK